MSQSEFAAALERTSGREISYDTYRKYEIEDSKKGALLRHDLIVPFCELTRTHLAYLLEGDPFPSHSVKAAVARHKVA